MSGHGGRELSLLLTVSQSALILNALAELPFKTVFEVIGQLNQQAHQRFSHDNAATAQPFRLSRADWALCIQALGELPFKQVNALLQYLNAQLLQQLGAENPVLTDGADGGL